jgi:3-phosphoshikimate 1-carboxyvinyltransferase
LAACFAHGTTVIKDASELRVKESDRLQATAKELNRMGAAVEELDDGLRITGGRLLVGASCRSYSDHRIAMTLGIAGLLAAGETTIASAETASISYPSFWTDLAALEGGAKS